MSNRTEAQILANRRQDAQRGSSTHVRLTEQEMGAVEALRAPDETVQGFLRRLLRVHASRHGIRSAPPRLGRPPRDT